MQDEAMVAYNLKKENIATVDGVVAIIQGLKKKYLTQYAHTLKFLRLGTGLIVVGFGGIGLILLFSKATTPALIFLCLTLFILFFSVSFHRSLGRVTSQELILYSPEDTLWARYMLLWAHLSPETRADCERILLAVLPKKPLPMQEAENCIMEEEKKTSSCSQKQVAPIASMLGHILPTPSSLCYGAFSTML